MGKSWVERFREGWRPRAKRWLEDLPPYGSYQVETRLKIIYGEDPVPACLLEKFRHDIAPLPYVEQESYLCMVVEKDALRRREKRNLDAYFSRHRRAYDRQVQEQEEVERREHSILARCLAIEATMGLQPAPEDLAGDMGVSTIDARRCIDAINAPIVNQAYYNALFENVREYRHLAESVCTRFRVLSLQVFIEHGIDTRLAKGLANYLMSKNPALTIPRVHFPLPGFPPDVVPLKRAECSPPAPTYLVGNLDQSPSYGM